jgi:hypothetical protein
MVALFTHLVIQLLGYLVSRYLVIFRVIWLFWLFCLQWKPHSVDDSWYGLHVTNLTPPGSECNPGRGGREELEEVKDGGAAHRPRGFGHARCGVGCARCRCRRGVIIIFCGIN